MVGCVRISIKRNSWKGNCNIVLPNTVWEGHGLGLGGTRSGHHIARDVLLLAAIKVKRPYLFYCRNSYSSSLPSALEAPERLRP